MPNEFDLPVYDNGDQWREEFLRLNRYTYILPCECGIIPLLLISINTPDEHNRVSLQAHNRRSQHVDYINASNLTYPAVPGTRFIATQLPTSTVNDFWQMVADERVSAIVMLTADSTPYWKSSGREIKLRVEAQKSYKADRHFIYIG